MNYMEWFTDHLHASMEDFIFAIQQVPTDRLEIVPPHGLGEWPAKRYLFHLIYYETHNALPAMKLWLGDPLPDMRTLAREDEAYQENRQSLDELVEKLRAIRGDQIALCHQYLDEQWTQHLSIPGAGEVQLYLVVGKTWQHTLDHCSTTLRIAWAWDVFERPAAM